MIPFIGITDQSIQYRMTLVKIFSTELVSVVSHFFFNN